jgi:transposase
MHKGDTGGAQERRYTAEFQIAAVRQLTERGQRVLKVAEQLGITTHSLYRWIQQFGKRKTDALSLEVEQSAKVRRVRSALPSLSITCRDPKMDRNTSGQQHFRQLKPK